MSKVEGAFYLSEFTTEQLEKELEKRKAVKPRATPEMIIRILDFYGLDDYVEMKEDIRDTLDWPPQEQSRDWEKKFCLIRSQKTEPWDLAKKDQFLPFYCETIPFDGNKLWEVTE